VLKLATFSDSKALREQVMKYNEDHPNVIIEIEIYENNDPENDDRIARLQREIATGNGPDIINYGSNYANSYVAGCYTENLLDYMDEDWQSDYFDNILKAFYYKDGLYAIPTGFSLQTFSGNSDILQNKNQWTIQEMMEIYNNNKDDMILYPGETKLEIFSMLTSGIMEQFVDWENGSCNFESAEFQALIEFSNLFPEELYISDDFSFLDTFAEGKAILLPTKITDIYDICTAGSLLGEENITYIGYPVEEGSGTLIGASSIVLAISSTSDNKAAAWEFIRYFITDEYQMEMEMFLPISRNALYMQLDEASETEYEINENGEKEAIVKQQILIEGSEPIPIYNISENERKQLLELIDEAECNSSLDYPLYLILLEEVQSYFSGDKEAETVCNVIQSRAEIYVGERMQ